ncbi:hypothetical protein DPMN_153618 [Dreissena polymorpha]|uniref:Uncharacterized protein n=1 Tax=Dreissena polymorpha TaxID=45954 RepID=A0A9D4FLW3_DREPO|nr:hypothetical protein DPMN_153618 [Dreissena polymorpha]
MRSSPHAIPIILNNIAKVANKRRFCRPLNPAGALVIVTRVSQRFCRFPCNINEKRLHRGNFLCSSCLALAQKPEKIAMLQTTYFLTSLTQNYQQFHFSRSRHL